MSSLGNLDGSFDSMVKIVKQLDELPKIVQKHMTVGIFQDQLGWANRFNDDSVDKMGGVDSFVAQLMNLNKTQQDLFLSTSTLNDGLKDEIFRLLEAAQAGKKFNSQLFEQKVASSDVSKGVLNELISAGGLKDDNGNYTLPNTDAAIAGIEDYVNHCKDAEKINQLFNAGIIEQQGNLWKLSPAFLKDITVKNADTTTTVVLTAAQKAWNIAMQLGKQLLLSLGIAAVTFIATKIVDYIMDLKTRSEELVDTMNDSHDAAEQATKDVEEIQSKIDDLNQSLQDAGVEKIEDIIDPDERERLQAINDMLQAQLGLKKQLSKEADDKANADTSAVVNDTTENSIIKFHDERHPYAEVGNSNTTFKNVSDKITKTESLQEHSDYLDELVAKRRELATAGQEDTQAYKDNEAEIEKETEKVQELSSAVSEQMDNYATNADSFGRYQSEYVAGTNAMTAATKALANANDDVGVSTTNYDILLQKVRAAKNEIDNGTEDRKSYGYVRALDTLTSSGLETGDDIRELSMVPANQTKKQATAIAVLQKAADAAHVTLDQFISALESVGLISVRDTSKVKSLSDAMSILDNMQSAYQSCAQAVKEYNKTGYVTMDTLQSLCQLEPQYLKMLELKNGKLKINTKTAQSLTQANIQLAKTSLLADTLNNIKENNNLAKAKSILGDVTDIIKDADTALEAAAQKSQNEAKDSGGWEAYDYTSRANSVLINNYHTLAELFDTLGKQDPSKIWGKDDKSTKQATSAIDAWSTLSSAMEEYNKQGSISYNTMKSLMGLEEKYTSCLMKQGDQLTIDATAYRNLILQELEAAAKTEDASDATKKKVEQYNKILQYIDKNAKDGTLSLNELRDAIEGVGASLDEAQEKASGLKSAFGTIHDILNTDNPAGALTSDNVESVIDLIQEHSELKDILYDESGSLQINEASLKKATIALLENEKEATKDAAIQAVLQKSIDDLSNGVISITDYLKGLNTELDDIDSKLDKFQSGFSDITDIVDEYNQYGKLTQDSMQKLLRLDPAYLECLEKEGDQLKFNAAQYRMLYAEQLNQLAATAKTQTQRDVYASMLGDIFGFTPEQLEQYKSAVSDSKNHTKELVAILNEMGIDGTKALQLLEEHFGDANKYAQNFETTLNNIKSVFSSLLDLFNSGASKKSNDLKIWGDAINDVIDERIKKIEKQEEALDKENEAEERAIELVKAQDALARAQTQHTARVYGSNGYEWEANSSDVREAQQNIDDKRREWRNADAKQALEDEKKALNDLKDEYAKVIELIGMSLDDYNKKMKYTAQIQAMTLQQMSDSLTGYKDSVLANMKVVAAGTNMSNAISNLEKLISTLETLNQIYNYVASGGQDVSGGDIKGLITNYTRLVDLIAEKGFKEAFTEVLNGFQLDVKKILFADNSGIVSLFQKAYGVITTETTKLFGSGGIAEIAQKGIQALTSSGGILGSIGTSLGSLFSGEALAGGAITIGGTTLSIPVVGAIAAAVGLSINNGVQQISKIYKKNQEIWADDSKSTGEKIIGSIGNVLYHLSPVEGWDLAAQYAEKAANGDGIWDKISNGFKSVYYACGLGVVLDNLWATVKKILHIKEEEKKDEDSTTTTEDASSNKNLSINGTKTTTKTKVPTTTDPTAKLEEKKTTGPSTLNWITNPLGSGVDTLTGYDYSEDADNSFFQELAHTVSHPIETIVDGVVGVGKWIGGLFSKKKHATGLNFAKSSHLANVDEQGPELIVRQPASGRYTYLETGDGVVPADITSKLFEMGGNSDAWFQNQMAKYGSATSGIQTKNVDNRQISIGDINVNNPVGDAETLAKILVQRLPSAIDQQLGKR